MQTFAASELDKMTVWGRKQITSFGFKCVGFMAARVGTQKSRTGTIKEISTWNLSVEDYHGDDRSSGDREY